MEPHKKLDRVMETETISKNGAILKSQTSKVIAIIGIAILSSCAGSKHYSYSFAQTVSSPAASTTEVITPPIKGINVPGTSLTEKLTWLQGNVNSHNTYILEVSTDENIAPHTLHYKDVINITVVIRGDSTNRIIRLRSNGTMFTIRSGVTLILDNNITLHGHSQNTDCMVHVNRGIFKMNNGSTITGNNKRGVMVEGAKIYEGSNETGVFEMSGGTISNNTNGGVYVSDGGNFTMNGGTISNNTATDGGGVYINCGTFTMISGTIFGNTAHKSGGGVRVGDRFNGRFNMRGGNIYSNTAHEYGGGVYVDLSGGASFVKNGGSITGFNNDQSNGNWVGGDGNTISRRGHAVFATMSLQYYTRRRETTAGATVNLSVTFEGRGGMPIYNGAWEQDN